MGNLPQSGILEPFRRVGEHFCAKTDGIQMWEQQQMVKKFIEPAGAEHEWVASRYQYVRNQDDHARSIFLSQLRLHLANNALAKARTAVC